MTRTTYQLDELIKEYNKIHKTDFAIHQKINDATVIVLDNNFDDIRVKFTYAYSNGDIAGKTWSLSNFCYEYSIYNKKQTAFLTPENIRTFMFSKLDKNSEIKIEIWPSEKIKYAYLEDNYYKKCGTLGNSCMRHSYMQKALNFYEQNKVKIVVVTDKKNKIRARALLWEGVKHIDKKSTCTYLDRIYSCSSIYDLQYIESKNAYNWEAYKGNSPGTAKTFYYLDNITVDGITHLPYADTFRSLWYKDGILTSGCRPKEVKHVKNCIRLTSVHDNGYCKELDPNAVQEVFSEQWVSKKDCIYIKQYNGYILKKNIINIRKKYYSRLDKKLIISPIDDMVLKTDAINEVISDNVIDKHNAKHVPHYDYYIRTTEDWGEEKLYLYNTKIDISACKIKTYKGYVHKKNIIQIDGQSYHKDDEQLLKKGKHYLHMSQCFVNYKKDEENEDEDSFILKTLIPKNEAVVLYTLEETEDGDINFIEVYYNKEDIPKYIKLNTGEYIIDNNKNRKYIKKLNKYYYLKKDLPLNNKNQLELFK